MKIFKTIKNECREPKVGRVFDGDVLKEPQYEDKVKENEKAFKAFCQSFGLDETGGEIPNIPMAPNVNCWIKKIKIHIDNYSFSQNK